MPLGTGDALRLPIDRESGEIKALTGLGLPTGVAMHGSQQINLMFRLTGDQLLRCNIGRIDDVLPIRYSFLRGSIFRRSQFEMLSRTCGANSFGRVAYSLMLPV